MEKLHYNLSDEDSSKGWRILLGLFSGIFLLTGVFIVVNNTVFNRGNIPMLFSLVPFSIGLLVAGITTYISVKRKEQYFNISSEVIEFRYGLTRANQHSFKWDEVKELVLPRRQKKARLHLSDGSVYTINLIWLDRKKASQIRKYLLFIAREKELNILKVTRLDR